MSSTLEIELLDVDLDADVPCECWMGPDHPRGDGRTRRCGEPAVARVRTTCPNEHVWLTFVCSYDLALIEAGRSWCSWCLDSGPLAYLGET